jgi:succinate dehydrogenase assembly factor 1
MVLKQSGLQRDIFALYRKILREAGKKDRSASSSVVTSLPRLLSKDSTTISYAAAEFRRQAATVKRSDFKKIEYLIRKGEKQVKLLSMPGVTVVGGTATGTV